MTDSARACRSRAEADRHPQLVVLLGRQDDRNPAAEGRRIRPKIDRDVEQPAGEAADQLALRGRMGLEMKAADRARPNAQRLVVLDELDVPERARQKCSAGKSRRNSRARPRSCAGLFRTGLRSRTFEIPFLYPGFQPVLSGRLAESRAPFKPKIIEPPPAQSRPARTTG